MRFINIMFGKSCRLLMLTSTCVDARLARPIAPALHTERSAPITELQTVPWFVLKAQQCSRSIQSVQAAMRPKPCPLGAVCR